MTANQKAGAPVELVDQVVTPKKRWNGRLDCQACRAGSSMIATDIPVFNSVIRTIGAILLIPSALAVIGAVLTVAVLILDPRPEFGIGHWLSVAAGFVGAVIVALVASLISWLLLMRRDVYWCRRCGFLLSRA